MIQSLNGCWKVGINRRYDRTGEVPGLPYSADKVPEGEVWYKRTVHLPEYTYQNLALVLYGAKYAPSVYVNGTLISCSEGGLTKTVHPLQHADICPGADIELEICLKTLKTMDESDASYLPKSDQWRSNVSSHIWDDVEIVYYNNVRMEFMVPEYEDGKAYVRYKALLEGNRDLLYKGAAEEKADAAREITEEELKHSLRFTLYDGEKCIGRYDGEVSREQHGQSMDSGQSDVTSQNCNETVWQYGRAELTLTENITLWSSDCPKRYKLCCEADGALWEAEIGFKKIEIVNKHFVLNEKPVVLRMGTVVWHRAYRDEQFPSLAYDTEWFYTNIIKRLKEHGANALRFHLGNPPRRMLELCDRYGLLTQVEWSFFHDAVASSESMERQYETWIGESLQHPSTAVVHPWNEVDDMSKHAGMIATVEKSEGYFPKFLLSHRDIIHIHAYWWSLFENLGLYYDSYDQFDKPVLADEFGGNYLDYNGEEGLYPTIHSAMQRFLGKNAGKDARIWLNTVANGKVAEYWRRIGVAGFSPFCIMSSPEDGSTHFFGSLKEPEPMPVWEALKPAYKPVAVSMDIWDRNFEPGEKVTVPLHIFNDTEREQRVTVNFGCGDAMQGRFVITIPPYSKEIVEAEYIMPFLQGPCCMMAAIGDVVSSWDIFVQEQQIPETSQTVGILKEETELAAFLQECGICTTTDLSACDRVIGMRRTYEAMLHDKELCSTLQEHLRSGKKAALLSCGPKRLDSRHDDGIHFPFRKRNENVIEALELFDDLTLRFTAFPEGESHVHPVQPQSTLWKGIQRESLWLWNGLRGGLIVPAVNMEVEGLSSETFAELWQQRGADAERLKAESYLAYECMGLYEFDDGNAEEAKERLMRRVEFLLADAPALKTGNETPEITAYDLAAAYRKFSSSSNTCTPVVRAGKELKRVPAVEIQYGEGTLLLTQMLFDGRLNGQDKSMTCEHKDPVARQLVLNLLV